MLDLIHRWTDGVLGLVLAVLGLTGAVLIHKEDWIGLPHASDAKVSDPLALARLTDRLLRHAQPGDSIVYASDRFGLVHVRSGEGGSYVTQAGETVARWESQWERPELWLFDLHHRLFAGEVGEWISGLAGLAAMFFVISGSILWWRTRRTFRFRLLPKRMTGPGIRMHHRDLGIVFAPLLLLAAATGAMMIFRPVAGLLLSPFGPASAIEADLKPPNFEAGGLSAGVDWGSMVVTAHRAFPDAELRILTLPKERGDPVTIRMRRAAEWLPNGRTMLWFDPADGKLLATRDGLAMANATKAFNALYPLHAAKVGGMPYRLAMTAVGLALFLLGVLAVWSFWFRPRRG